MQSGAKSIANPTWRIWRARSKEKKSKTKKEKRRRSRAMLEEKK